MTTRRAAASLPTANAPTIGQPKVSKFRHLAASQHVTA